MVQPFSSVYTKSYRKFWDAGHEKLKPCYFYADLKENFLESEDSKTAYNAERDEEFLRNLYLNRLITIYQQDYCMSEKKKSMVIDPNNLDADPFMVRFNNYYRKKTKPLLPPPDTTRRIHGYCRFDRFYTGKSTYEEEISYEAYKLFKKDYDEGKSRQFRKKQKALQKEMGEEQPRPPSAPAPAEEQHEESPSKKEPQQLTQKICAICCEKYSDFFYGCPDVQEKEPKSSCS